MKTSSILGLNSRSQLYLYRYNSRSGKRVANSKILTNRVLDKAGIPNPQMIAKFKGADDIFKFNWDSLPAAFALKPSRGMGGEGIIVVKKRALRQVDTDDEKGFRSKLVLEPGVWITTQKRRVTIDDLKLHTLDILEGAYSIGNVPDVAFIQEYIGRHKAFRKYAYRGTPDIRIIVFNKVPVMAMLRLPTKESAGRANLHQGAIGVGIDIATGITTRAIWHGEFIRYKPIYHTEKKGLFNLFNKTRRMVTKRKLHGIKIPNWNTVLTTAVNAQIASSLGYCGVDVVLHPEKGSMVLELNAQPGLQIQLVNMSGLKKRLERIEDLDVRDAEHGVKIAKALFAERFADRVAAEEGVKTVSVWEKVKIVYDKGKRFEVEAKLDTGAWKTSIDKDLAERLGILQKSNILWTKLYKSGLGQEKRRVINLSFYLAGRKIDTIANIADRKGLRTPMIIGRRDLVGFLVKPTTIK